MHGIQKQNKTKQNKKVDPIFIKLKEDYSEVDEK